MSNDESSSSLRNFIKGLDYFAVTFEFRVDNKQKYGSFTGGIWFIIYILVAISYTIKRFFDYISWQDSKIQFIEKSLDPSPSLNFKEMNFSYAVRVTFDNDTSVKNSLYSDLFVMEHSYVTTKDKEGKKKIKGDPRSCKDMDFYNRTNEYSIFNRQPLKDFDCFDFYDNFTLKGIYTDAEMSYSEVLISLNKTYFENYDKLEKIFSDYQFKFTLYYIDTFNDVSNFTKPVFYKIDAIYTYLDINFFKRNNLNFQQFQNEIDGNLFYNDYKSRKFMKMFSNQEIIAPLNNRSSSKLDDKYNLNKFILRAVNNEKIVRLSFVKIPEFLASLSGLLVNMLVVLAILMKTINSFEAKQSIMSKIMKYKDLIKSNNKQTLIYLSKKFKDPTSNYMERHNSLLSKRSINRDVNGNILETKEGNLIEISDDSKRNFQKERLISEDFIDKSNENITESRNEKRNPYMIKCSDICCLVFCCRSIKKKQKIFKNAESKFNHNIDLVTFMKKMQEVEILKYLLLDRDTLKLMNFISKPCVSLTNTKINDDEYTEFFETIDNNTTMSYENIDSVKKSYDLISAKNNLTFTEERILKLFDLQIEQIIQ